jgi:hypothetical protein
VSARPSSTALATSRRLRAMGSWSDPGAITLALLWIPAVLWADRSAGPLGQVGLGVGTWALLLWWLWHESPLVRAQTAVVVVLATVVEYVFSGWLGVYVYRLDHVPAYVPPGHGLVYLAALTIGRTALLRRHRSLAVRLTLVAGGAWALWGVTLSPRPDLLGLFWYACLAGFLLWGRSTLLYVGAFLVVSYLELLGTRWGVWTWAVRDPIVGWVPMGNPPSIAAGGYGWFDLYAGLLAPFVLTGVARLRSWWVRAQGLAPRRAAGAGSGGEQGKRPLVQQAVCGKRTAAVRSVDAVKAGEPAAGLGDHKGHTGDVVQVQAGLGRHVDGPLGHQQVAPEVAERPAAPHRRQQRLPLRPTAELGPGRLTGERQRRVREVVDR